ncbi:hypothetical protein, partial [Mycobacterium tuberculosis]
MIIGWSAITGIIGWPALVMLFAGPRVGEPGKPVRLPIPWRDVGGYRPTGRSIAACRRGEPRGLHEFAAAEPAEATAATGAAGGTCGDGPRATEAAETAETKEDAEAAATALPPVATGPTGACSKGPRVAGAAGAPGATHPAPATDAGKTIAAKAARTSVATHPRLRAVVAGAAGAA